MPSSKVRRAKDKRDIQVHSGALQLADYKWSLKNWDGQLLATQFYMISSQGGAGKYHPRKMGRYTLMKTIVLSEYSPVYEHDDREVYLYKGDNGEWSVGEIVGDDRCFLSQSSGDSPSPLKTVTWEYSHSDSGRGWKEDVTLKVYPSY